MQFLKARKLLFATVLAAGIGEAWAVAKTWVGGSSDWHLSTNWSPSGVPAVGDDVYFTNATPNCVLGGNAAIASITFNSNFSNAFDFNGYTLTVDGGSADFRSSGSFLTPAGSVLIFKGSALQTLYPRAGEDLPYLVHEGDNTLQIAGGDLSVQGFLQLAGTLDLNGNNLATVAGGNFSIHNGHATSLIGLGGRTLTVGGATHLSGTPAADLSLSPASAWTLVSTGAIFADFVTVGNSTAGSSQGVAFRGTDNGGNTGWAFAADGTFFWNRNSAITSGILNRSHNWAAGGDGSGYRPPSLSDDPFTSDALGGSWSFLDNDGYTGGGHSLTARPDQLEIAGRGQNLDASYNAFNGVFRGDITGDFDVTVKLLYQSPTIPQAQAGILVADDPANLAMGGYCALTFTPAGNLVFRWDQDGNGTLEASTTVNGLTGPIWLRMVRNGTSFQAWYRTTLAGGSWTQIGTAANLASAAANSQVGLVSTAGTNSEDAFAVFDDFQGGTDFAGTDYHLSFNGSGANADADAILGMNTTVGSLDFTGYTGNFSFGSYILDVSVGNATFAAGQAVTPASGTLVFSAAAGTQTFTPKSGASYPGISKTGAGTVVIATNALTADNLTLNAGTWDWGASSLSHDIGSLTATGGTMTFGSNTVSVTSGNVDFGSLGTLNANSGNLQFIATGGIQTLTPKPGAAHPALFKSAAGTLRISGNSVSCPSFTLSGGTTDFATGSLSLISTGNVSVSGGNLDISTNTPALSVGGNLSITGGTVTASNGTLDVDGNLDMSSGTGSLIAPASNSFTVGGSFTVWASAIFNANSGTVTFDAATTGKDIAYGGSFAGITFNGSGGGWTPTGHITATGTLTMTAGTLDISTNARNLTVGGSYNQSGGTLTANNGNIDIDGNLVMSAGTLSAPAAGTFTVGNGFSQTGGTLAANAGVITLDAGSSVNFRNASSLSTVAFNGSGATWTWQAGGLISVINLSAGTLNFGTGHTINLFQLVVSGGNLDFGSSTVQVGHGTTDLSNVGTLTPGTGTLQFQSSSDQWFIPKAAATHPALLKTNPGTLYLQTNDLIANGLQVDAGGFNSSSNNLDVNLIGSLTLNGGTATLTNSDVTAAGSLILAGGTLLCPGSGRTFQFGSGVTKAAGASVTHNSGTLTLAGSAPGQVIDVSGTGLNDVTLSGAGSTWTTAANLDLAGTLTLSAGTLDLTTNGFDLTAGGLTISGGTLTAGGASLDVNGNVSVSSGAFTLPASGETFTVTGSVTHGSGTFNAGTGTLTLDGTATGSTLDIAGTLNNLTLNGSGGAWTLLSNLAATGTVTLSAGTLDVETNIRTLSASTFAQTGGTLSASTGNVVLTGDFNQSGGTFTAPGSARLFDIGGSLVQTGGTFTPGTGTILFTGSATGNIVNAATTLTAANFSGSGEWTLTANPLDIGDLTLSGSTLRLGSGLTHAITGSATFSSGNLDFGSSTLRCHGSTVDLSGISTLTAGTGTLEFMGATAKTFTPKDAQTHPGLMLTGSATVTLAAYDLVAGNLDVNAGVLDIGSRTVTTTGNLTVAGGTLAATNGTLDVNGNLTLGSGTLTCPSNLMVAGNFTAASGATLTHNSGSIHLDGAATGKTLDVAVPLWNLNVSGSGGAWTAVNNPLTVGGSLAISAGTLALGSGLTHTTENMNVTSGGLDFGASTLQVTGTTAYLGGVTTMTPGTGTLQFTRGSGTQTLTPNAAQNFPHILHSGAGTLLLSGADLTCLSFHNSAGSLDITNRNISTVSSGDFTISNGTSSTLVGLAGRTLTVAGNASLSGTAGNDRLNLDPAGAWTLAVTGTLSASLASIGNGTASVSSGAAGNCANIGGNAGWTFAVTWDGGGGNANWSNAGNWGSDYVPTAMDAVTFNATSVDATLDAAATVKSISFTSGYTGTFSFSSNTLTVEGGGADFRSGGAVNAGTGTLAFTGGGSQTFIPKTGTTFPAILHNSNAGTTTVSTNPLTAGILTLGMGTFNLGASMTHTLAGISGGGGIDFGTSNLNVTGNVDLGSQTVTATSASTLAFTGTSAQTYIPKASEPDLNLTQNGTGGTTVSTYDFTAPTLTIASGTLVLGTGRTHAVTTTLSISGGGLDFGSSTLQVAAATVDLSSLGTLTPGTGTLYFNRSSAQTFTPKASATHPDIRQYGAGTTTLVGNNLTAGSLTLNQGTFHLGAGLTHAFTSVSDGGGGPYGSIDFGSSQLQVTTGNAQFANMPTVTVGTGSLAFTAAAGTQVLTPKSGGVTHPPISHTGAGTVQLGADLTCAGFSHSAGALDFNGFNIATVSSGDFTVANGNSTTLIGLAGRTLAVDGNASLSGASSASKLNLDPASGWVISMTGAGTLAASLASLMNGTVSGNSGVCTNCANAGGNSGWSFATSWDGGGGNANWSTAANWGGDAVPTADDDVTFDATSLPATLDAAATVKSITFTSGYSGAFSFSSQTLTINSGHADFRSGGAINADAGTLAFTSSSAQTLIPKAATLHPHLTLNGSGGVTLSSNAFSGGDLTLTGGTLTLGTGLTHSVGSISATSTGGLVFGNSTLRSSGATVDLGGINTLDYGTGTLEFTGSSAQTFTPKSGVTHPNIAQSGTGTTTVAGNNFNTASLQITGGTFSLGTGRSITASAFTATGGGLDFGTGSTLEISAATVDFSSLASITPGTGTLELWSSVPHTFIPKAATGHPTLGKSGSGTLTIGTHSLSALDVSVSEGTLDLGNSFTHSARHLITTGGTLTFNGSTLQVSGDADFSGLAALNEGTGTLEFNGSGIQSLTPKASATHPGIAHTSSSTVRLITNAFTCRSFAQSAGTLDFNSLNLTTSAGDFTVTNGTSTTFSGLAGRTLTIAGNASFTGTASDDRLGLNPGSAWNLAVTGTLGATFASMDYGNASVSAGTCTNCANGGNNSNWNFNVSWDGGGGNSNWTTAQNWGSDYVPASTDAVIFSSGSAGVVLDADASVRSIQMTSGFTGNFDFSANSLTVTGGDADFSSGGTLTAGTGSLVFTGSGTQAFRPRTGNTMPAIIQNGSGTTTVTQYSLTGSNLTVSQGTFHLGSGMTHTVAEVAGSGALDFGTSHLTASGNVDLSGLTVTATSSNTLSLDVPASVLIDYTPNTSITDLCLAKTGAGTARIATNGFTTPSLSLAAGTLSLNGLTSTVTTTIGFTGGTLDPAGGTLRMSAATVDFSNLAAITSGGTLEFSGSQAQTFTPFAASNHGNITLSGAGGTTIATRTLVAGTVTLSNGTLTLGTGGGLEAGGFAATGGGLDFGAATFTFTGTSLSLDGLATLTRGTGRLRIDVASPVTLVPKSGATHPEVVLGGTADVTLATHPLITDRLTLEDGRLILGSGFTHTASALSAVTGGLDFGSSTLKVAGTSADFSLMGTLTPGTGILEFANTSALTFIPKASATFPRVHQSGSGTTTLSGNNLTAGDLSLASGTLNLGTGLTHSVPAFSATGGTLEFGGSQLDITTGDGDFGSLGVLTAGTGTLSFTAASGTQVFTIPSAATCPMVSHTGAGTLRLAGNPLTAHGFTQSGGTLDLNGLDLTTTVGDFTVTGGTASSFAGLGGRTVTVGGNASFTGQAGNLVNLNPATPWNLAVAGSLSASLAQVMNSNATASAGSASASVDGGNNVNWAFTLAWDGGGTDNNWSTGANWAGDATPTASTQVVFDATSVKNCTLDGAVTVKSIAFTSAYTGTFSFATNTLNVTGNADFRSGGALTAGSGTLAFAGSAAQTFIPHGSSTLPGILQNGSGGTTLATNALSAGHLQINLGAFGLGSGQTHAVASIGSGGGNLDFGGSSLRVTGNADLSGLAGVTAGTGRLEFAGNGTQAFSALSGATHPRIAQTGTGTTTVSGGNLLTNSLRISAGTFHLGTSLVHAAGDTLLGLGGTLDFGSSTLRTAATAVSLSALTSLVPGTGTLEFNGSAAQTFTPLSGGTHPAILQSGAGGTTVVTHPLSAGDLTVADGSFTLGGTGWVHAFANVAATGGALSFGSSTLETAGNVDLGGLGTLTAGTGTLRFTAAAGTQVFTPRNGAVHPLIVHDAAGTVQLSAGALDCLGFTQTAGAFDLNGLDLTVSSAGNLAVSGATLPLANLSGRTLTVAGDARFTGTWASRMQLDPGSAWTLAVTGTLQAANVRLGNSVASVTAGLADSSVDLGGNSNWTFLDTIPPADVGDFTASALSGSSVALAWTASPDADADSVLLRYRTDGIYPTGPADGTLWRRVKADRTADTATGLADKAIYHFAAFVKDSSGNWSPGGGAATRDSARTPDVTPPANVTALAADALTAASVALAWTPSPDADADTVMIRYRTGLIHPADPTDGTLWRKLPAAADRDTLTGLAANTLYAVGLFVRDSSGNWSQAAAGARDTALFQLPVTGSIAISDVSGLTRDGDPALAFAWSGADSLRFGLAADSAAAPWKTLRSLDSLDAGSTDGRKIFSVQFQNIYGKRSAWFHDTTVVDRLAPGIALDLEATHGRWTWPVAVSGEAKDTLAGVDRVMVVRRRLSDGFHYNGASWQAQADTAKLVLSGDDSLFTAPMPAAAMATGDYEFTAQAVDRAGNASAPLAVTVHYEDNRLPALAYRNVKDTVPQNQAVAWKLDFGDLDAGDSLAQVSFDAPAWLAAEPGADTAWAPWAIHKTYALTGTPGQDAVGANIIQVRLQDRGGLILAWTDTVHVADVNDAPVWNDSEAVYTVKEDETAEWTPRFVDADPDDRHSLALLAGPAFAKVEGLAVILTPGSRDVGESNLTLVVSDGELMDTLRTVLTVTNVNDPPYAFASTGFRSPFFFKEDRPDSFTVVVVDMDRNEPIVLAGQLPAWMKTTMAIDSTGYNRTFTFRIHPAQKDTGAVNMALTFVDQAQAVAQLPLTGRILADNDVPTAVIEEGWVHGGAARFPLSVVDEDGSLEKARFHYRLVGPAGDTIRRGITPSALLALHPLADGEYRLAVRAEDQDGMQQPEFSTRTFTVSGATTLSLDTARWHMLGPQQALLPASAFGAGATLAAWDEAGDDGQPLARYASGKTVESLKRGKGYWVRLAQPVTLVTAQKDLAEGPIPLKLTRVKQGWNQVANPHPYWVDLSASRLTFWEWDADKRDLVNSRGLLKPWAAYWVLAAKDTTLLIADAPYFPALQGATSFGGLAKSAAAGGLGAAFRHRGDWSLQVGLRAGRYHDEANRLGVRAADSEGPADPPRILADAPKFGDYLAFHFENPATGEPAAQGFAQDFRAALHPDEEWWDFSVENRGTGETQALLSTEGLEGLASAGLKLFLVKRGEARLIEPGQAATLAVAEERTHYSLVVTPHADFAGRLKGDFSISQNFPNPVTTFTSFRFVLPQSWDREGKRVARDFKLRIKVYDYSGREVARPVDGKFRPGTHVLRWTPATPSGGPLAKGAYVYRLETAGFVKSRKMVVK